MDNMHQLSRRSFLVAALGTLVSATLAAPARARGRDPKPHPDPRPGITGAKVATREQLKDFPALVPLFDAVREMPEIADGIRCHCGCADTPGFRSLLSCYEGDPMAVNCRTCQGQARLAARMHKDGKSLNDIRAAIDAKYA